MGPIRASFPTLIEMHKKAAHVSFESSKGFYSGRCFSAGKPTEAIASMLAITDEPKKTVYPIVSVFDSAIFDKMSLEIAKDYYKASCEEDKCDKTVTLQSEDPMVIVTKDYENPSQDFAKATVLKFTDYFVVKVTYVGTKDLDVMFPSGESTTLKNAQDFLACYYFKKLK